MVMRKLLRTRATKRKKFRRAPEGRPETNARGAEKGPLPDVEKPPPGAGDGSWTQEEIDAASQEEAEKSRQRIQTAWRCGEVNGKPLFSCFEHPSHENFTEDDHWEAMREHYVRANGSNLASFYFGVQLELIKIQTQSPTEREQQKISELRQGFERKGQDACFHLMQTDKHRYAAEQARLGRRVPPDANWLEFLHEVKRCLLKKLPQF